MRNFNDKKRGISIIGVIFLAVVIILTLGYFHISIKSIVESPVGQENINYVGGVSRNFWNDYLKKPTEYVWNDLWIPVWKSFTSSISNTSNLNSQSK